MMFQPFISPHVGRPGARSKGAFTLIELLVVISIISMLIAILLPALGKARTAAHVSVSLSNVRQLGVSFFAYAHDNKSSLPYLRWDVNGGNLPNWSGVFHKHGYVSTHKVFWSPGRDTSALSMHPNPVPYNDSEWYNTGYGANVYLMQDETDSDAVRPAKLYDGNLPPHGTMILSLETWRRVGVTGALRDRAGYYTNVVDNSSTKVFTYDGKAVRNYLDGHANANLSDDLKWNAFDNFEGEWTATTLSTKRAEPWYYQWWE